MRIVVVILLLGVFFLGGTIYGMNQQGSAFVGAPEEDTQGEEVQEKDTPPEEEIEVEIEKSSSEPTEKQELPVEQVEGPVKITQTTASFLESAVSSFYDLVVGMLYQLSELFY